MFNNIDNRPAQTQNEPQNSLNIFAFQGNPVTFRKDNGTLMVNATEMAKNFGKAPKDWLRTDQTQEFISTLSTVRQICPTELVKVVQGGNAQGTWMHEDVALEFARWLSPVFGIWCNDRIKELLLGDTLSPQPTEAQCLALPYAARHEGFLEWQAQVKRYIRPKDKKRIAQLYGCCTKHVYKVIAGSTVSMPLSRMISEYAEDNYHRGISADQNDRPVCNYQLLLFPEEQVTPAPQRLTIRF